MYNPAGSALLSTILAAIPVIVLLGAIGIFEVKAHLAALLGLAAALLVAILVFGMPSGMATMSAVYGAAFGLFPIGWIILNVIFLYQLTNEKGEFDVLQRSIRNISDDRRLQLLFIAFCFGAFFEGAAGFGTPVAVTAAMLIGLGFSPLAASGLSLIANTAPVAYGALGTPVIALAAVTGLDLRAQRHDRPPAAVLLGDRPVLADLGVRRLPPHARDLARSPDGGRQLRRPAIPGSRTSMARGWWSRSPRSSRWLASPCSCASGNPPG